MDNLIEFQKFPEIEGTKDLVTLLKKNNIPFVIDDKGQRFILVSNPLDNYVIIKISKDDLEKVNQLLVDDENKELKKMPEDHYLYTFSDDEIVDIIANPFEWSKLEIRLANEIAKQRNLVLSAENLNRAKKKKLEEVVREEQKVENSVKQTANWFGAIAIISVINSIVLTMQINIRLIFGLGITQFADGVIYGLTGKFGIFNIIISIVISSIFVLFWFSARKEKKWAFIVGTIIYGLDTIIFLFVKDWLSVGFHIFVIIGIMNGYLSLLQNNRSS